MELLNEVRRRRSSYERIITCLSEQKRQQRIRAAVQLSFIRRILRWRYEKLYHKNKLTSIRLLWMRFFASYLRRRLRQRSEAEILVSRLPAIVISTYLPGGTLSLSNEFRSCKSKNPTTEPSRPSTRHLPPKSPLQRRAYSNETHFYPRQRSLPWYAHLHAQSHETPVVDTDFAAAFRMGENPR